MAIRIVLKRTRGNSRNLRVLFCTFGRVYIGDENEYYTLWMPIANVARSLYCKRQWWSFCSNIGSVGPIEVSLSRGSKMCCCYMCVWNRIPACVYIGSMLRNIGQAPFCRVIGVSRSGVYGVARLALAITLARVSLRSRFCGCASLPTITNAMSSVCCCFFWLFFLCALQHSNILLFLFVTHWNSFSFFLCI